MTTWSETVAPLVARFEVAAKFGHDAVWNPTGSQEMGDLVKVMARLLDVAVARNIAPQPPARPIRDDGDHEPVNND